MTARRARLAAVTAPQPRQWEPRPSWAHPHNDAHQAAYLRAVEYLRRERASRWLIDRNARAPGWRALPQQESM